MEALLGFPIGFWDYVTFLALFILVVAGLGLAVFILGLPGRIARLTGKESPTITPPETRPGDTPS
jgi:hypothetical protein